MKMNYNSCPGGKKLHDYQIKIVEQILNAYERGFKNVVLQAPTGTGKSIIGRSVTSAFQDAYLLTPTRHLQNQYAETFSYDDDVAIFKGKSNYRCPKFKEDGELFYTADVAPCRRRKTQIKTCRSDHVCPYYNAMDEASVAQTAVLNFMSHIVWQMLSNIIPDPPFLPRSLHVVDEAHKIEDNVRDFLSIKISQDRIRKMYKRFWVSGLNWWKSEWSKDAIGLFPRDIKDEDVLKYLTHLRGINELRIKDLISEFQCLNEAGLATKAEWDADVEKSYLPCAEMREKLDQFTTDFSISPDNYGFGTQYNKKNSELALLVKPVNVSGYIQSKLTGANNLYMSATLPMTDIWARDLGIENPKIIDVPSMFPAKNRPVFFTTVGFMKKDTMAELTPKACAMIDRILDKFPNEKGIIHTPSYVFTEELEKVSRHKERMLFGQTGNGEHLFKTHVESPDPTILVSPAMQEGVDLKDELSRVQIVVKAPFASLEDPAVRKKMQLNPKWYDMRTLSTFLQQIGRSIRHEEDYARTYVMDDNLRKFLQRNKRAIPDYILEALQGLE